MLFNYVCRKAIPEINSPLVLLFIFINALFVNNLIVLIGLNLNPISPFKGATKVEVLNRMNYQVWDIMLNKLVQFCVKGGVGTCAGGIH